VTRLVMVVDRFPMYSTTFLAAKFTGLLERGWDVHVVCRESNPEQRELVFGAGEPGFSPRIHESADRAGGIAGLEPDLVHFEFGHVARGLVLPGPGRQFGVVVSFRGADLNYLGLAEPDYYRDVWEHADALHVLGEDLWRRALLRGCPPWKPHYLIPPSIDTSIFDPGARRHTEIVGGAERPLRILSVGRLHWKKGYEYALAAVRQLADAAGHFEYRIAGGPDGETDRERTLFAIHDLGLERHVELLGAVSHAVVWKSLAWADVFLHSAVSEGFGNAVLEAQAMCVPVVCTDADGLSENVEQGRTGFVVRRRDASALAVALGTLGQDPGLRDEMGAAGRRRVQERFEHRVLLDRVERMYREVLAEAKGKTAPSQQ
jgi:colanic acid/amylovoran biosynthesis glycosyltransferase